MMRALLRDGGAYAIGTIVTRGLGLLLLPLYTRALPPASFGVLDLIVTAGVLVNLIVPLETSQAVARSWNERPPGAARRRLAGTGLMFAVVTYAMFAFACVAFAVPVASALTGQAGDAPAVRAGAVFIVSNGILLVLQSQFRWMLRPLAFAAVSVSYALLVLGGMVALLAAGAASVAGVLWMQAAACTAVAAGSALVLRREFDYVIDRNELRSMLAFSLPLVPAGLAVFATLHLHRYVLGALAGTAEVGLFGVGARVASLATLALIGVQTALTPLIYVHHREPETPARLARMLEMFWGLALVACLGIAVFGRELIALLAAPVYAGAAPLLAWLAPAALLAQMYIFAPGIPLTKRTHWQLALTVASAALGLLVAVLLVPHYQALGAAVAAFAGAAAFFGAWLAAGQRLYHLPLRWKALALATTCQVLLVALLGPLAASDTGWLPRLALLAILMATLWRVGLLRPPSLSARPTIAGGS